MNGADRNCDHELCFSILGLRLVLRVVGDACVLSEVRERYCEFETEGTEAAEIGLDLEQVPDGWKVGLAGKAAVFELGSEWPGLDDLVRLLVVRHHSPALAFVHGASVARGGEVTVFIGASTSGKTTLSVELEKHGYPTVADDLTPIALAGNRVLPFRTAPSLRPFTKGLLRARDSASSLSECLGPSGALRVACLVFLNHGEVSLGKAGVEMRDMGAEWEKWQRMRLLCGIPPQGPAGTSAPTLTVRSPQYFARKPVIETLGDAEAMRAFMKHLHAPTPALDRLLPDVATFVKGVRCYSLRVGRLEDTCALVKENILWPDSPQGKGVVCANCTPESL